MKLATFLDPRDQKPRLGALLDEETVLDVDRAALLLEGRSRPYFQTMTAWLSRGDDARGHVAVLLDAARLESPETAIHRLDALALCAPVPRPGAIRDCLGFERHLVQCTRTAARWRSRSLAGLDSLVRWFGGKGVVRTPRIVRQQPIYYKGNPASVVGHDAEIPWPPYTQRLDYELEYGIYIGKEGRDIPESEAADYIGGFTIFNDFSARDSQLSEMRGRLGPAKGKDFDRGNAMGPLLVTPDEAPNPRSMSMRARVNGELWSDSSSSEMLFSWEEMIAFISKQETLYPGDFIGSGTAPDGCGLELDRWIQRGDVVELEVEGLGVLRNRIGA